MLYDFDGKIAISKHVFCAKIVIDEK